MGARRTRTFLGAFLIGVVLGLPSASLAQSEVRGALRSWKRGTAIVLFSGVGGGILGFSTLSFYGRPQDHTDNVTTGALMGVLAGAGYLMWEGAQPEPTTTFSMIPWRDGGQWVGTFRF